MQRVDLTLCKAKPVIGLKRPGELRKAVGFNARAVIAPLVEGKPVAEDACLSQNFLELELEFRPSLAAVVKRIETYAQHARCEFMGIVARRSRVFRADDQSDGTG